MGKYKKITEKLIFLAAVLLLWQLLYILGTGILGIWKPYAMPNPSGVWTSLGQLLKDGSLFQAVGASLLRGFLGYCIAALLGGAIGFLMNQVGYFQRNLKPLVMGIQTLPSICWVPFSILWFGLTEQAIIFVVVMGSAFSMSVAVDNAIRNVPSIYKKAALTMGADTKQLYWKIILPASLPELISGLKQGWSFAWRALMSGEVMTTCIGLGQTLITGRNLADINQVMLVMIVIVLVGIVIDQSIFRGLETWVYKKRGT